MLENSCWMEQEEIDCLTRLARTCKPGRNIVEIGSYRGCSTLALAEGAGPGVMVYSIDPHLEGDDPIFKLAHYSPLDKQVLYRRLLGAHDRKDAGRLFPFDRVSLIELSSRQVDPDLLPHPFGLVFVDGDHSLDGAMDDAQRFGFWLCPGGYLAMHDRNDLGPQLVIRELLKGEGYELVEDVVRMAVLRKVG